MASQTNDVLISSRLFAELTWLSELVNNSLFYFADFVKSIVRVDLKTNDVQKAFILAPALTKIDSKELNCQVAVQILFLGNYKGISKARLLTENAKVRCRAILFALNSIVKTEHNKDNILWPRLDAVKKKLGVFDFDKMPSLGVFQFTNEDYFKICTRDIYPIIEKMTIVNLLQPLSNETLNVVRRTMLFTLNAYSLNKVFKKPINGLPYIDFLAKEFSDRKLNKIVETENEIIPTPEGIEFHIISLNNTIKQLKAENKKLFLEFTKGLDTAPVAPMPEDFSQQIKLFTDEISELNNSKADLIRQLEEMKVNSAKFGVVDLALKVNDLKEKSKESQNIIELQSVKIKDMQKSIEEHVNMRELLVKEKEAALRYGNNNSKLAVALQDQLNNQMIKYKDLQQRMESVVEDCSKKDTKILQLNAQSGQLINATYLTHLEDKLKSLTGSLKNSIIDDVTVSFLTDCQNKNIANIKSLFRYREEADRPARLKIAQESNSTEVLTLDSVKWDDDFLKEKVKQHLKDDCIDKLCSKAASLLAYARTAESYDKLDKKLLEERLKNEKLSQALASLRDSEIEKTLEHVLDSFVSKSKETLREAMSNAEFKIDALKFNIDSKVNTVTQLINSTLDKQVENQRKRSEAKVKKQESNFEETIKGGKDKSSGQREVKQSVKKNVEKNAGLFKDSVYKYVRDLSLGDKFWWGHRNVMLTITEKFNPSKILPYADLETSNEMEAQKYYNSVLRCGYKSMFQLR